MRLIASFIYHKIMKWKMVGNFSSDTVKKCVVIAVPHTSWHDFYIGLLIRQLEGIQISFMAKKELFIWPLGWYFKKVGGIPIDRTSGQNSVDFIADEFKKRDVLRLTLAPEGTRRKVSTWKTGFYYIAKKANVPIIMVTFDFGKKQNVISTPFYPTDDMEKDFQFMYDFFTDVKGKVPENSFELDS